MSKEPGRESEPRKKRRGVKSGYRGSEGCGVPGACPSGTSAPRPGRAEPGQAARRALDGSPPSPAPNPVRGRGSPRAGQGTRTAPPGRGGGRGPHHLPPFLPSRRPLRAFPRWAPPPKPAPRAGPVPSEPGAELRVRRGWGWGRSRSARRERGWRRWRRQEEAQPGSPHSDSVPAAEGGPSASSSAAAALPPPPRRRLREPPGDLPLPPPPPAVTPAPRPPRVKGRPARLEGETLGGRSGFPGEGSSLRTIVSRGSGRRRGRGGDG